LIIGNFFDDTHTDTIIFGGPPFGGSCSYYYIDDVCVSNDSLYNENWTGIAKSDKKTNLRIYPNPVGKYLSIELLENLETEIKLYNTKGQIVLEFAEVPTDNKVTINIFSILSGYYILSIKNKNSIFNSPLIIIH